MVRVPRRLFATVAAAAMILILTTGSVAAADPDSLTSGASVTLGAKAPSVSEQARLDRHGGGLELPATDIEPEPLGAGAPASGVGVALATWVLVFVAGALASLRYMARRSRL